MTDMPVQMSQLVRVPHTASTIPFNCTVDAAGALPRSDRAVQPWSFAAVSAMARPWYRASASSFSLGCRCASLPAIVVAP